MSKRITITCPACSATLAAPVSAVGKTLLCPKCRTGIPVQKPTRRTLASIDERAGDAINGKHQVTDGNVATRRQKLSKGEKLFLLLTFGVSALLAIAILINWGTGQYRIARRAEAIERAFKDEKFDLVLTLEPNHVDAQIARAQQRLQVPQTNVKGAMSDLAQLQRLVPDHPIFHEMRSALATAESVEHAEAGRIAAAIQELENATRLKADVEHARAEVTCSRIRENSEPRHDFAGNLSTLAATRCLPWTCGMLTVFLNRRWRKQFESMRARFIAGCRLNDLVDHPVTKHRRSIPVKSLATRIAATMMASCLSVSAFSQSTTIQDGTKKTDVHKALLQKIERDKQEVKTYKVGHVVVGRIQLEGTDDPEFIRSQMMIFEDGFFSDAVRDLNRPIAFRMLGYHPVDAAIPAGASPDDSGANDLGTIRMEKCAPSEFRKAVGM